MGDETLLGIRISTLALPVAILAVVGIVDALLRWMVRRKVRRDEAAAAGEIESRRQFLHWLDHGLKAAVPPLALLLWVFGGYAALSTVLVDAAPASTAALSLGEAAWVRDVATVANTISIDPMVRMEITVSLARASSRRPASPASLSASRLSAASPPCSPVSRSRSHSRSASTTWSSSRTNGGRSRTSR